MMRSILVIASFAIRYTYIKSQSEYPGPGSLRLGYNIQNMSANADTILISPG